MVSLVLNKSQKNIFYSSSDEDGIEADDTVGGFSIKADDRRDDLRVAGTFSPTSTIT